MTRGPLRYCLASKATIERNFSTYMLHKHFIQQIFVYEVPSPIEKKGFIFYKLMNLKFDEFLTLKILKIEIFLFKFFILSFHLNLRAELPCQHQQPAVF